jgi:hypothetical protein
MRKFKFRDAKCLPQVEGLKGVRWRIANPGPIDDVS